MKIFGHIDADCFYVSCERVRDPRLCGKPVAVLGNQGACVIARSYEIRTFGVTVGMPVWEAKKLCPEAVFIKRDFQWYALLSGAMQDVLGKFSNVIEYYSIDESFVDLGEREYLGDLNALGARMRDEVLTQTGIPVSVGLSVSRTLAKMAAKRNKPFGVTIVLEDELNDFLTDVSVSDVPGIGRRLAERLERVGVTTVKEFTACSSFLIKRLVHKPGEELWYELQGKSVLPVRGERPERKNLSRGGSLWGHHKDRKYVWAFLVRNLERVADSLWEDEMETSALLIVLISSDGRVLKSLQRLPDYTCSYSLLLQALRRGFDEIFCEGVSYCGSHLLAEDLRSLKGKQMSFFEVSSFQDEKFVRLKRLMNSKFGVFAVRSGATAYAPAVFRDEASNFEISDIKGKFCF